MSTKTASKAPDTKAALSVYESEYNKLNQAQKQAVDTIEGPVMVIAGPGTGKTQTLALRVATILRRTQMRPSNILCLTFSVSGATAMRERLRLLIGADAYVVTISTVHGFCQSIIDRNPALFEEWSVKEQISDIVKMRELNTIIDQVSAQSELLNQKDPYSKNSDILSRISQVKREGKTLQDLLNVADEYDNEMATKSKPGTKVHDKNLRAARKFRDFIEIFKRYQSMLEETGRYDYDDMILFVLKALKSEDWLLAGLQERYQYILVDEAQDLNGAQWDVIHTLTTFESLPHEPNLFLVGDDDQAIYRFQGANITHILAFKERFPKAPVIPLTISYRSTQAILSAAERLIAFNEDRLVGRVKGLEKHLEANSGEEGSAPVLLRAPSDDAEPWMVADLIEERLKQGIPAEEIAVLTQTNRELFSLYDVIRAREIPVVLHGKADLLTHSLVLQAVTILSALEKMKNDSAFIAALACECFAVHPADLARIAFASREAKKSIHEGLLAIEQSTIVLTNRDALLRARDIVLDLSQKTASRTVLETVEHVLRECGLTPEKTELKDPLDLAAIEAFFRFVKERCLASPSLLFRDFMADLQFYSDPAYAQVRLTYTLPHLVTEGVQLITAHQSKGLEFHTVILTNFREGHWDKRINRSGVAMPEDLLFGWEKEEKAKEKHEDERRVAFVAMTRAKKELIFTCAHELAVGEKSKPLSPSVFFAEAGPLPEQDLGLQEPEKASLLLLRPLRALDSELEAYLRTRLETFALSATSLTRFLRDPLEFKRIDLLGQPEEYDEGTQRRLGYGSAVHWALREWAVKKQKAEEFSPEDFVKAFQFYLDERTILTTAQRNDLLALGTESLTKYYAARLEGSAPFLHAVERNYFAQLGDIPLKGKIDRIDLVDANSALATVIDYKTGAPKAPGEIRGGLDEGTVSRTEDGSTFRQLAFYALLLEQAEAMLTPAFALEFIGERGDDPIRREFSVTETEKEDLRRLIKDVWAKIQALDFSPL